MMDGRRNGGNNWRPDDFHWLGAEHLSIGR